MIKSRKIVIEHAVKKIFGDDMNIKFISNKKKLELNKKKSNNQLLNKTESEKIITKNKDYENQINLKENKNEKKITTDLDKDSSKNLAQFFNGEIIDINE